MGQSAAKDDTWEAQHQRVTFYCPKDLQAALREIQRRNGASLSRIITTALQDYVAARLP